jgi:diguanylate cyclase (GGDEF)-like protein
MVVPGLGKVMLSDRTGSNEAGARPILSIRARLVVLALLAVAPLMLERVRLLEASRSERLETAAAEVMQLARQGMEGQREVITAVQAVLKVLARGYESMHGRGDSCEAYLNDFVGHMPFIRSASITDGQGRITCSSLEGAIGLDIADRDYFHAALIRGEFVVSRHLVGRVRKQPTFIAAYPLKAATAAAEGVIITSVDLRWLTRLPAAIGERDRAIVALIDRAGTIVAGHPEEPSWVGRNFAAHPLVQELSARAEGITASEGLDGIRRLHAFVRVPWTDAWMVVGLPESEALQRVDRDIRLAYLQLIVLCLLVLVAAWYGGERLIVQPIQQLARIAARFGRGEMEVRLAPSGWAKEFQPLAVALNDMARRVAEREHELRSDNHYLAELASVDALSGLANRRAFDARIEAEWARAMKLERPLGLLMIDIDHFKAFNDHYGHLDGDACLRRIGVTLGELAEQDGEFAARYGGEEFVLLMPDADLDRAMAAAGRLCDGVQALAIPHAGAPGGRITLSVGVAVLTPVPGQALQRLVEAADAGLYAAKRRGRDTVVAHGGVELEGTPLGAL